MVSLIISLIMLLFVIIITIVGINSLFKTMIDNVLGKKNENFENNNTSKDPVFLDACKKMDIPLKTELNFQTGTNIPLSPNYYEDHVGQMYIEKKNYTPQKELHDGNYCAYQNELLYDGIWQSKIMNPEKGMLKQNWDLTSGNIMNDYTCSNDLIRLNKPIPKDYRDYSSTPPIEPIETGVYFNDALDDPLDLQINCFPTEFNKGITPNTKDFINPDNCNNTSPPSGPNNDCLYGTSCMK